MGLPGLPTTYLLRIILPFLLYLARQSSYLLVLARVHDALRALHEATGCHTQDSVYLFCLPFLLALTFLEQRKTQGVFSHSNAQGNRQGIGMTKPACQAMSWND
eukprot:1162123-Pelagomonas_calceolata.AAC.5